MPAEEQIPKITFPLSFIIFFSVLNGMMFQVAVPDIAAEYSLLPSEVSWVMTGYIMVFAVGALIYGKLADIYPVKTLITTGLVIMNIGSLIGLFSFFYPMLVMSRLLQAGGGASIPALAMIVVTRFLSPSIRGKTLGIIAGTVALAAAVGPLLGGFISGMLHWRYLFVVTLATVFAIPFLRCLLPDEERHTGRFDAPGAVLISAGISLLLVSVAHGFVWALPSGIFLLVWFCLHIRRTDKPFVSSALFKNRAYRNTVITTFLTIGSVFGMMFMVPLMLRDLNGLGSEQIGLVVFPGAMTAVLTGVLGGRLSDRRGSRLVVYAGAILLLSGFLVLSTFAGHSALTVALKLVICYAGFSLLQSSLPHTVSNVLDTQHTGIGMGMYNLTFFISGAFFTAGIGRLLDLQNMNFCLNPLTVSDSAWIYSNIFLLLAFVIFLALVLFRVTFRNL